MKPKLKVSLDKGEFWHYCPGCHNYIWSQNSRYTPPHKWEHSYSGGRQLGVCTVERQVMLNDNALMESVCVQMMVAYDRVSRIALDSNSLDITLSRLG